MSIYTAIKAPPIPKTPIDARIFAVMARLMADKKIQYESEFYEPAGLVKQQFRQFKVAIASFSPGHIEALCQAHKINANWVFGLEKNMFR